jgi:hypothetical protein
MSQIENMVIPGTISIPFNYAAGRTASRFFIALRDEKKILGTRCSACRRVIVPPRAFCGRCSVATEEWVEVSDCGTLVSYTVTYHDGPHLPQRPPVVYGIIRLDGADSNLVHLLDPTNLDRIEIGARVQAVFREQREGRLLDIAYFKLLTHEEQER